MASLARQLLIAGAAITVAAAIGVPTIASAADTAPAPSASNANPPSTVETFAYPNADKILAKRQIKLKTGDGHITLADSCLPAPSKQIRVWGREGDVCFEVSAAKGFLTLELPKVWALTAPLEHPVSADLSDESGQSVSVDLAKGKYKSVGEGTAGEQTTLLELRVTG
ncbi:hypothetical protein [Streptomyces sp. NPDC056670]|uniref:hypothetical protein n=1 Tax=Streptomyces sp. NPDC056670 TaxID=3345904 RepID=UPI00367E90BF